MSKILSRRAFLKSSAASIAATGFMSPLTQVAFADYCINSVKSKTIVQIDMDGGLASHMFLAPTSGSEFDSYLAYNSLVGLGRPNTGNDRNTVPFLDVPLPVIGRNLGLHPQLTAFDRMVNGNYVANDPLLPLAPWKCAIINKTGYPRPDGSHDLSRRILETGVRYNNSEVPGWVGKIMDRYCTQTKLPVFSFAGNARELTSESGLGAVLEDLSKFTREGSTGEQKLRYNTMKAMQSNLVFQTHKSADMMKKTLNAVDEIEQTVSSANNKYSTDTNKADYPIGNGLGNQLREVAKLIRAGLKPTVCLVTQGGYDLHGSATTQTINRLRDLNAAIRAFLIDITLAGKQDEVIIVSKTDFGRNSFENGNTITQNNVVTPAPGHDHGAASLTFVIGTKVANGVYGPGYTAADFENPDIVGPSAPGVLLPQVDFREVRAQVLDHAGIDPAAVQTDATMLAPVGLRLFA